MTILTMGISVLLGLFFVLAGSVKLTGWQKQVFEIQLGYFRSYGLNRSAMAVVGGLELCGAALLGLYPAAGALLLAVVSAGALSFHLRFDTLKEGAGALITLMLSLALLLLV
ncbi:DoxX-like family protein [Ferrimonas sediminum]|uniref:DoxX-like family protein n=1 Tax=Ferrimonas sediminum TaxID=718193 RepID=A0A1G8U9T5_9GAMM|nr:DoxX family protein [Ferrimonas sediminum]SDJ50508.1 DoxX-like family protein [Ferrimonas sediminum]